MKDVLTGIFAKGALKMVLGVIFGASVMIYPVKKYFELQDYKEKNDNYHKLSTVQLVEINNSLNNKILPYLSTLENKIDSVSNISQKSLTLSKANYKANIEMSKQLKGFDILKFYDPFMMWNNHDSSLKKKNRYNLIYATKLENE